MPEEKQYRETVEGIASNIAALSRSVSALLTGRLKRKAIVLLLAHSSGQSQRTIEDVLKALEGMEIDYTNKG